jgi:p24 family protein delta-1
MGMDDAVASIATRPSHLAALDDDDEDFQICFADISPSRRPDPGTRVSIRVEIQHEQPKTEAGVVEKLDATQRSLYDALELAKKLESELYNAKMREHRHRDTSESTNTRIAAYSWLSFGILAALGVTQMLYLRRFFKSKHIVS